MTNVGNNPGYEPPDPDNLPVPDPNEFTPQPGLTSEPNETPDLDDYDDDGDDKDDDDE